MNFIKAVVFTTFALMFLSACSEKESYWRLDPNLSTLEEQAILKASYIDTSARVDHYNKDVVEAINRRASRPVRSEKSLCEFKELISLASARLEASAMHKLTIKEAYYMIYLKSFDEVCYSDLEEGNSPTYEESISEEVPEPERKNVVTTEDDVAVLSPEMMTNLKSALKTCPRARDEFISLTNQGSLITVKFYKQMTGIIHRCQLLELENSL